MTFVLSAACTCLRRAPLSPSRSQRWRSEWRSTYAGASPQRTARCGGAKRNGCATGRKAASRFTAPVSASSASAIWRARSSRSLAPFVCPIKAYDPWVSDHFMAGFGVASASVEEVLKTSQVIVVFASVTNENHGFLGKREFEMIAPGSVFLLMSRAGVIDFPEFLRQVESGRFRAATDVFPAGAGAARRSRAKGRGPVAVAASGRRDDARALRDRRADGRGRRSHPARPAAPLLPARAARDGGAFALEADRMQLTAGLGRRRCALREPEAMRLSSNRRRRD